MKFGISTASLYPLETEKALEFLGKNNVAVTELFFNSPRELEPEFITLLDKIRTHYGIQIVSVHPCGSVGEPYFMFSNYTRRYEDTFEYYKKYYYAASVLEAKTVVLHGDTLNGHIPMSEYCQRLLKMQEEAEKYSVGICHENVNKFRGARPNNILEIRKFTDDKIKFTLDIKQTVRDGCGFDAMYNAMKGNIINVHISDNNNDSDCMLPLAKGGEFNFDNLFSRLKSDGFDGACLIEVYRDAYKEYSELLEALAKVKNIH